MHHVFVAYAEEDRQGVEELAHELKSEDIICWCYTLNTVPGKSWMDLVPAAIRACRVVLLIASSHSIASPSVTKEVRYVSQEQRPILPVLIGSPPPFRANFPDSWQLALTTLVEIRGTSLADSGLRRKIAAAIRDYLPISTKPASSQPQTAITRWPSDGSLVELPVPEDMIYLTNPLRQFILGDDKFFLSGNKGQGKTLLLRRKRSYLMERYHDDPADPRDTPHVMFIPQDKPFLDQFAGDLPSLKKEQRKFLCDLVNCRRMWSFAIRISILSHFEKIHAGLLHQNFPENLLGTLPSVQTRNVPPTIVFKDMLSLESIKSINRWLDLLEFRLDSLIRQVHSGVYVFLDRIEQGLDNLSVDAWVNIQTGLLEAAWNLMSANRHIKIYATVRAEAYANYRSASRNNYSTAVVSIYYTSAELRGLIQTLLKHYERVDGYSNFVGLEEISNIRTGQAENSFSYLSRHTVHRPRDFVMICSQLSERRNDLTVFRIRQIVNYVSGRDIVPSIFEEMSPFLKCLNNQAERERFFSLVPANILSRQDIVEICNQFNDLPKDHPFSAHSKTGVQVRHPFCELYTCGLLGVPRRDAGGPMFQKFKLPQDLLGYEAACLPEADWYLMHPSLYVLIQTVRPGQQYNLFRYVIVGHDCPWEWYFAPLLNIQKQIAPWNQDPHARDFSEDIILILDRLFSVCTGTQPFNGEELNQLLDQRVEKKLLKAEYGLLYKDLVSFCDQVRTMSVT